MKTLYSNIDWWKLNGLAIVVVVSICNKHVEGQAVSPARRAIASADGVVNINQTYQPTAKMGDIGDLIISDGDEGSTRFTYKPQGLGPHEWDYKYVNGEENTEPAGFTGCLWMDPASDFGNLPGGKNFQNNPPIKVTITSGIMRTIEK